MAHSTREGEEKMNKNRVLKIVGPVVFAALVGADMFVNGIFGGDSHETISHRLGRAQARGSIVATAICVPLNLISHDHCRTVSE